jgi:hypothetical protein
MSLLKFPVVFFPRFLRSEEAMDGFGGWMDMAEQLINIQHSLSLASLCFALPFLSPTLRLNPYMLFTMFILVYTKEFNQCGWE